MLKTKRGWALLLAVLLITGMLPVTAFAAPAIQTSYLPEGEVDTDYKARLVAVDSGEDGPVTLDSGVSWKLEAGKLPGGLQLDESNGVISGVPTLAGTFNFRVTAEHQGEVSPSKTFSITISDPKAAIKIENHVAGGLQSELEALPGGVAPGRIKQLEVLGGALNDGDFAYLRESFPSLEVLNFISSATAELPDGALDNGPGGAAGGLDNLRNVALPNIGMAESIRIGANAFRDCKALTAVSLNRAAEIGAGALSGCVKLRNPDGRLSLLQGPSLAASAFEGCGELDAMILPPTITRLEQRAFAGIPALTLTLEYDGVVQIEDSTFADASNITVRVPESQAEAYRADPQWAALLRTGGALSPYASSGLVEGFSLSFAQGEPPQPGGDLYEGDYFVASDQRYLGLHPQGGRELLLAGGDGSFYITIGYAAPERTDAWIRLTGDAAAIMCAVGDYSGIIGASTLYPIDLRLAGDGHRWTGPVKVEHYSRLSVTGGLTMNGRILISENAILTADGSLKLAAGRKILLERGARLELLNQSSEGWLDRLEYRDEMDFYPDEWAVASFSDGTYYVNKDGVTPALAITTSSLPAATLGQPYKSLQLETRGGKAPYHFTLRGKLPSGMMLSEGGVLSGTPEEEGSFSFEVEVGTSMEEATAEFVLTVERPSDPSDDDTPSDGDDTPSDEDNSSSGRVGDGSNDGSNWYVIEANAGPGGSITPAGRTHVAEGKDQKFVITPNEGYVVRRLVIDSKNAPSAKEYTFQNVRQGHTIYVAFERGAAPAASLPTATESNPKTGARA